MVGAEAEVAVAAFYEGVGEVLDVAAGDPGLGMHEDGGVQADDVIAPADHGMPPSLFDVAFKLDAEGAVVPSGGEAAVDLAALKDETAPLGQG